MVVLSKIYTKTGDSGMTALGSGKRVAKTDLRIEAGGDVDETNCALGTACLHAQEPILSDLRHIQNDLFDLGADLCVPGEDEPSGQQKRTRLRIQESQTHWLEGRIDAYNEKLSPLRSFILPGGTVLATALHQARAIARRAERRIWVLHGKQPINPTILIYINRLSDFLFVAARHANDHGKGDILWAPGQGRSRQGEADKKEPS